MATRRKPKSEKAPGRKPAARRASSPKKPAAAARAAKPKPKPRARKPARAIPREERHRQIAEAAYFLALRKGFENSDPRQNWVEAERQVDAELAARGVRVAD